jgi:hypothetical protein
MPLQSHGRVWLAVAICFITLFLTLKVGCDRVSSAFKYTRSTQNSLSGIRNETLGVSSRVPASASSILIIPYSLRKFSL